MNIIDKENIKHYHRSRIPKDKSITSEAQGWTSRSVQEARFNAISSLIEVKGKSILDIGCGYGDLKVFLEKTGVSFDYIGIDQQCEFISSAKERFKTDENTWFYEVDAMKCQLPSVDLIIASGVLSYSSSDPNYYFELIKRLYSSAKEAFIFNMLDSDKFESGPLIIAHDRKKIFAFCQEQCDQTILVDDYLPNDFTIRMQKS